MSRSYTLVMKGGDIMEPTLEKKNPLKAAFANLRWFEWVMFAGMILIGAYYMVTDKVSIGVCLRTSASF